MPNVDVSKCGFLKERKTAYETLPGLAYYPRRRPSMRIIRRRVGGLLEGEILMVGHYHHRFDNIIEIPNNIYNNRILEEEEAILEEQEFTKVLRKAA